MIVRVKPNSNQKSSTQKSKLMSLASMTPRHAESPGKSVVQTTHCPLFAGMSVVGRGVEGINMSSFGS